MSTRLNPLNRLADALQGAPSGIHTTPPKSKAPVPAPVVRPISGAAKDFAKLSDSILSLMLPEKLDLALVRQKFTAHIDATPGAHDWRELWPGFVQQLRRTPPAVVAPAPAVKVDVVRPNPWRERLLQRANQTGFVQNLERVLV